MNLDWLNILFFNDFEFKENSIIEEKLENIESKVD